MNVTIEMIERLQTAIEAIDIDSWGQDFFDNFELRSRTLGRIVLLRDEYRNLPPSILEWWFDVASNDYAYLKSLALDASSNFHTMTLEEHDLTETEPNA